MIKKLILILIGVFILLLGSMSAYISTIDWNKHKDKIAEQFANITGKRIVFDGNLSLSVLPSPYLSAKNIKIYNKNANADTKPLAVIDELVTNLSLMPLLHGNFVINNMSLIKPNILVEVDQNGNINWHETTVSEPSENVEHPDVSLNSVMLKDASVQIINPGLKTDIRLENVNAEVTAQSIKGPYRIDGNFVKDNNPAGFALTLGTISDSFATSLNLVLTHPTTESYARFDGSMLMSNNEINGNFIVESKKPSTFLNSITNQMILPEKFNYPLAISVELKTNKQQIDLSSFIVKYGENTAGAGNILIPLYPQPDEEKRQIVVNFEMTELDLQPIEGFFKEWIKKYDTNPDMYRPNHDFDLSLNIKSLKALYNGQDIRSFAIDAALVNNVVNIKNLSALLPGDTDFQVKGDIFEKDKNLSYNLQVKSMSQDFLKFINWLNIKPQYYKDTIYRNAKIDFDLSGNLKQIKVFPINFQLDRTSGQGVVGIIRDVKNKYFISFIADSILFDNYLPSLNDEQKKLSLTEKIQLFINNFSFLKNLDLHFDAKLNSGTYNTIPFEQLSIYADIKDGNVVLQDLSVGKALNSVIKCSGNISNLENIPSFNNFKYDIKTTDLNGLCGALGISLPQIPLFENAKLASSKGIFTGNLNDINIKTVTSIEKFNSVYSGKIYNFENKLNFNGDLEFKTPDFTNFIRNLGFNYQPQNMPANIFTFKGDLAGNANTWKADKVNAFVGTHNFVGNIAKTYIDNRTKIDFDITANKLEFDRFIYNPISKSTQLKYTEEVANFLKKPVPDKTVIDYDFFKTFDMNGKFQTDSFNYKTLYLKNMSADISILKSTITAKNIKTKYNKAPIDALLELNIKEDPKIKGQIKLEGLKFQSLGGKKYSLNDGTLSTNMQFESSAASFYDFISQLNGKISFDISNTVFKGWNLAAVEQDLKTRTRSDNLFEFLRDNLQTGETVFDLIGSEINIKNGAYSFKDSVMSSPFVTIDFIGNGNLTDWTADISFLMVFEYLKDNILPIEFQWKGTLNTPNLVVDATALKNKYDGYWERLAKQKMEEEQARIKALNEKMATVQEKIKEQKLLLTEDIFPKIEQYKPLSSNSDIKSRYDSNHMVAIDINNQLDMMIQKAKQEFNDADVTEMNAKVDSFAPQLKEMLVLLNETFAYDVKFHAAAAYKQIQDIYDNVQTKSVNYQKTLDAYVLRLLQLGSMIVLDRDPKASDYKNQIETSLRSIEDVNAKANETKSIIEVTEDITELNRLHKTMEDLKTQAQKELQNLNTSLEALFTYARKLVQEEELIKIKALQQSELSEPENNILIIDEDTDKTTSQSPISETQKVDEAVEKEKSDNNKTPQIITKHSENDEQKDDEIVSYSSKRALSGTITVGKKTLKTEEQKAFEAEQEQKESLLKPLSENKISSSGTITKKK